jgi:hypothetical protein
MGMPSPGLGLRNPLMNLEKKTIGGGNYSMKVLMDNPITQG